MNIEYIKKYVESTGCELLSTEYKNAKEKLKIKCKCGEIFYRSWNNFSTPTKSKCCNKCSRGKPKKWTIETVKEYINKNSYCELLSDKYINYSSKMLFKCKCGKTFETSFQEFKGGNKRQCNICGHKKASDKSRLTIKEVRKYVQENSNCELISDKYINNSSKLTFKCECGNTFKRSFANFKKGEQKCRKCVNKELNDRYKNDYSYVKEIVEVNGCKLLSEYYINSKQKLKIQCKCGNIFSRRLIDFTRNRPQCPECSDSLPIIEIKNILSENNIKYESEYTFEGLNGIHGKPLRYDIAILNNDSTLKLLIEYDGEFHYKKFYEEQKYEDIVIHDKMKNEFCKKNNIKLIRISYKEKDNIFNILKENVI